MHPLREAVRAHVALQVSIRKPALNLLAYKEVGRIRMAIQEVETAVDAVVVRDGNKVHTSRLRDAIDGIWRRITVARAQKPQMTRQARIVRVQMKICTKN